MSSEPDGRPEPPTPTVGSMRKMVAGITILVVVCLVGMVGYVLAGWSVQDSTFMVVITIFGVGYGEVRPVDTLALRFLTGFVIVAVIQQPDFGAIGVE